MERNWSVSLEHGEYANNIELLINDAMAAVSQTSKGFYVNIVTPARLGHPDGYLTDVLQLHFGNTIDAQFIDQCGCGGYVLRVWKSK
ncbi:CGCGG family rSAM-modified RiPP protein [Cytobacillus oceanisediminis]|uniref:CGCGG family putative rSAM-modified RiPP protein n=1 Tax=Cytobacillus oceanisediminis TaxID=665099 RepID=UPI0023DBA4DA|nr:CGCGG family rSAM-modified RiPP protein [Cytobacillus oceanisediminis]MDF2037761.1 CGCGG family rSAM-modified RiPP protein [Cytobacillus oceanisediminis]